MITVREVGSQSELQALREPWKELLERTPSPTVFSTHEWASTWWKHFGGGQRLLVLVLSRGTETVGIVPWWIGRTRRGGGGFRKVAFLGTGLSDYLDVILPDPMPEAFDAVHEHLDRQRGAWDFLDLREMPEGSPTARSLAASLARRGSGAEVLADSTCAYIPVAGDWSTYATTRMGKRSREHSRRRRKRLKDSGDVRISLIEDLGGDLASLRRVFAVSDKETGSGEDRRTIFADATRRAFFEEISTLFSDRGWLQLATLEVDGRTVAYHYGFLYDRKYLHYYTGYDPAFAELQPGRVVMEEILKQCFERGLREVDFLRGVEPWKSSFTDLARRNQRLRLFRPSIRGRLARFLDGAHSALRRSKPA